MKDEIGGQIMKEFTGLRAKTYTYLKNNIDEDKKAKCTKKVCHQENLNFKTIKTVEEKLK